MEKKIYEMPECEVLLLDGEVITTSYGPDANTAGHTEKEVWVGPGV